MRESESRKTTFYTQGDKNIDGHGMIKDIKIY